MFSKFSNLNGKYMKNLQKIAIALIIIFALLAGFFAFKCYKTQAELEALSQKYSENVAIVSFVSLFTDNMLASKVEVPFEERLKMENAVRAIGNEEILRQWEKFTESATDIEAQENARILLLLLVQNLK